MAPVIEELHWDLLMFLGRYGHQDVSVIENWPLPKLYQMANALVRVMKREGSGGGFHEASASGGA